MKAAVVLSLCGFTACMPALADEVTRYNFDTVQVGGRNVAFGAVPDLTTNLPRPGTFPNSSGDVWGAVGAAVNVDILDNSVLDPTDVLGLLPPSFVGKVFGAEDLLNPDNAAGVADATWVFDVSGYSNLSMSIDFAAMGNFDNLSCPLPPCFPDMYNFTVSVDGGPAAPIFTSSVDETGVQNYTLQSGIVITLNDPLLMNGIALRNTFQTISAPIAATGSLLTLTLHGQGDSSEEVFLLDNIRINGTPGSACDVIDFNQDGLFPDTGDIDDFLSVFSGGACSTGTCGDIDFNNDGLFPDTSDIDAFIRVFSGGACG